MIKSRRIIEKKVWKITKNKLKEKTTKNSNQNKTEYVWKELSISKTLMLDAEIYNKWNKIVYPDSFAKESFMLNNTCSMHDVIE